MAVLKLDEGVIDAAIAKLKAGMEGRVAAINTEIVDDVTITTPSPDDYHAFGFGILSRAPAIVVTPRPTEGEAEAEGPHSFIYVCEFRVVIYDQDTDRQRLGRKLLRLSRAAVAVLWDDDPKEALPGSAHHIKFIRTDPGPVFEPDDDNSFWRSMFAAEFRAWQLEG